MQFDFKTIEQKFQQLPEDVQVALTSTEVTAEIKKIAADNGLLLDQVTVLADLVTYVLLGLVPSGEFVKTFVREAKVDTKVAAAIATAINDKVFAKIRSSMQKIQTDRGQQDLSILEKAGGFSIEHEKPDRPATNMPGDRSRILAQVENPAVNPGGLSRDTILEHHAEPLPDQLLPGNTVPEAPAAVILTAQPPAKPPTPARSSPDSYREPF